MDKLLKPNRDALEEYFNERTVSDNTRKNYIYMFVRIQEQLRTKLKIPHILKNIHTLLILLDEQYVLAKENNFAREVGLKPVISAMFLKILLQMIKNKIDYGRVIDAIEVYDKHQIDYTASKTKSQLEESGVSYDKLTNALKDKQINEIDYVLLFLLIKFGVRNTDLSYVYLQEQSQEENHMFIEDKSVVYVRNKYKLKKTFGTITVKITDEKFVSIIENMIESGKQFLFMNRKNATYTTQTMGHYIKQQTKRIFGIGLTESVIHKTIINHYKVTGNDQALIDYNTTRPHHF
tara:strand:- start:621 stop:1496 length:876 start_codon:yes stop_codon:yes gene_type:complete